MTTDDRPWARHATPAELLERPTTEALRRLPEDLFAALIRDNLLPRGSGRGSERGLWESFWGALRGDDGLSDRAFDVLQAYLDLTEDALENLSDYDESEQRRIRKFHTNLNTAWDRLERTERQRTPRGRLSTSAKDRLRVFNAPARETVVGLVAAIVGHQQALDAAGVSPSAYDERLWHTLRDLRLEDLAASLRGDLA